MSTAKAWRAEWTVASGHPAWTEFATEAQADLFALRMAGAVVDVRPVLQPVLDELPRVSASDLSDAVEPDPERFAEMVDGAPARSPLEQRMVDVVAGLRRTVVPAPSVDFARALRACLSS